MLRCGFLVLLLFVLSTCTHDKTPVLDYKTENVIIIVIDGPRYSETWGDPLRVNIPVRDSLLAQGVLVTNFRNNGATLTNPGHAAICTGNYENISNDGTQLPYYPSIMQFWLKQTANPSAKCAVIASKDKLHILSNCLYAGMDNQYNPSIDCGVNGNGTGGYRPDSITFQHVIMALGSSQPGLMLVNFKDPDYYGHQGDWASYLQAIRTTDQYVGLIWEYIQNDPHYKDKTTLIVTNDHGRHPEGVSNGYLSHGDGCDGCRHIEFFALSPDFKKNIELSVVYEQIDIPATVSELLHFPFPYGTGEVMKKIFL